MPIVRTALTAICMTVISAAALANVSLDCFDAEKPCARIDIAEGGRRAVVSFTGCTRTPGQYEFTNGKLRYEGGVTNDVWRQFVEEGQNELYFGETIQTSGTGPHEGRYARLQGEAGFAHRLMIIRGSIGTQSNLAMRCR